MRAHSDPSKIDVSKQKSCKNPYYRKRNKKKEKRSGKQTVPGDENSDVNCYVRRTRVKT